MEVQVDINQKTKLLRVFGNFVAETFDAFIPVKLHYQLWSVVTDST